MIKDLLPLSTSYDWSDKEWRPCDLLPMTTQQTHNNMESQHFFFSHTRDKTKNIFLYFFTKLKTYNRCFFYLQKMESVWEIEAPHIALNSGFIWRWDDKIHNYIVTYSWADVSLRFEPDRKNCIIGC